MLAVTDVSSWKLSLKKVKVVCRDESVLSLLNNERNSRDVDIGTQFRGSIKEME